MDSVEEVEYLLSHSRRNKLVAALASRSSSNALILCYRREHCHEIHRLVLEAVKERKKVHLVHVDIPTVEREAIRNLVNSDKESLHVIVGTFGTCSTGINMPSIGELVLAHSFKAEIQTLQSIGRALRAKEGMKAVIHDVGDRIPTKRREGNYAFAHLAKRLEIYNREKFPFQIVEYGQAVK